ncbi:unnamed protein product, partial [Amoebophrya sp. A120]|eukprot:GSA120T00013056001.1
MTSNTTLANLLDVSQDHHDGEHSQVPDDDEASFLTETGSSSSPLPSSEQLDEELDTALSAFDAHVSDFCSAAAGTMAAVASGCCATGSKSTVSCAPGLQSILEEESERNFSSSAGARRSARPRSSCKSSSSTPGAASSSASSSLLSCPQSTRTGKQHNSTSSAVFASRTDAAASPVTSIKSAQANTLDETSKTKVAQKLWEGTGTNRHEQDDTGMNCSVKDFYFRKKLPAVTTAIGGSTNAAAARAGAQVHHLLVPQQASKSQICFLGAGAAGEIDEEEKYHILQTFALWTRSSSKREPLGVRDELSDEIDELLRDDDEDGQFSSGLRLTKLEKPGTTASLHPSLCGYTNENNASCSYCFLNKSGLPVEHAHQAALVD